MYNFSISASAHFPPDHFPFSLSTGAKRNILKLPQNEDYGLLGLATAERDYRLAWFLDQVLNLDFQREEDLVMEDPKLRSRLHFPRLVANTEEEMHIQLIGKSPGGQPMHKKLVSFDFVLTAQGAGAEDHLQGWLPQIQGLSVVQLARSLDPGILREIEHLIFD